MGIERRKDGWYARVKKHGRWGYVKLKGCRTKKAAEEEYVELARQAHRQEKGLEPHTLNPQKWTLKDLMLWWLKRYSARTSSHARNESAVRAHILSHALAGELLEQVTAGQVTRLLRDLKPAQRLLRNGKPSKRRETELSEQTRAHVRAFISRAFGAAIEEERWLGPNPVARVKKPKTGEPRVMFLEREEVATLLSHLDAVAGDEKKPARVRKRARDWRLIYTIALYTGMRRGEIWALRWDDIDDVRGVVTIRRSNSRKTTKGKRARVVDLAPELAALLAETPRRGPLVCPGKNGQLRSVDAKSSDRLRGHLLEAGVDRAVRFHDLRHTFASWWLMSGGTLEALQEILGHVSIEMTRCLYGHLSRGFIKAQWSRFTLTPDDQAADVVDLATKQRRGG